MKPPYDYRSEDDMRALANQVRAEPRFHTPLFLAHITANDIMRDSWLLHAVVWFGTKVRRFTKVQMWLIILHNLQQRDPTSVHFAIERLAMHIEDGKDRVDPLSAGGLNAEEVAIVLAIMTGFGWQSPVQPVAPVP